MPWQCPNCGKWSRWRYRSCNICGASRPNFQHRHHANHHWHHNSKRSFNNMIKLFVILVAILFVYLYWKPTSQVFGNISSANPNLNNFISQANSTFFQNQINSKWIASFISLVNSNRTYALSESSEMDSLAGSRFTTMIEDGHYYITHYGAGGGDFGEVVFYPSGSTPLEYVNQLKTEDPLHWQLLVSTRFSSYGYHIGNGPDIEAEGYCNAPNELPGPGINVSQWLTSYGCTPVVINTTWLVIDLS